MNLIQKAPNPKIIITSYNKKESNSAILLAQLTAFDKENHYPYLLSYSFSENTQDLTGQFSFSIAGGDNTLFDKIEPLQIIQIYEGSTYPLFTGIITTKSLSCSMSDSGVRRNINISGKNITSLIADFQLILDLKYLSAGKKVSQDNVASSDVTLELNKLQTNNPLSIKDFLEKTWELYLKYTGINKPQTQGAGGINDTAGVSNVLVYDIIKAYMDTSFFEVGNAERLPIPITNTFINQDINTVLQIWQCILAPPVYEIFSRVNNKGKTRVVVRETPFDDIDWETLPIRHIKSNELLEYTLHLSNDEIYTVYLAYLEGSQLSSDQYIVIDSTEANKQGESIFIIDEEKFKIYGHRMCQVTFKGYKKDKASSSIVQTMSKYSQRLKNWFCHLDEMYMGSITIVNDFNNKENEKLKVGNRVKFLGGEFYIRNVEHSWDYGGSPTISLQVIRGGLYEKGRFIKKLEEMGTTRVELKHDE